MSENVIEFKVLDGVASILLSRPKQYNSLNGELRTKLLQMLNEIENDISIKCVISTLRGNEFWELNNPSDIPIIEKILKKND